MHNMNRKTFHKRYHKEGFEMPRIGIKSSPKSMRKYLHLVCHNEDEQVYWARFTDTRTDLEYVRELSKKDYLIRWWRCTPPFVNRNSRGMRDHRADD